MTFSQFFVYLYNKIDICILPYNQSTALYSKTGAA
ncbi:hypothetical protein EVA_12224 [gut metagenome]|uniref:Uncharacterized protein n=1 Tax=gut metagenome TaxID=749906 RepID=J9GJB6_9ZZZZ